MQAITEGAAGGLLTAGAGIAATAVTKAPTIAGTVARALGASPVRDVISGAAGGAGARYGNEIAGPSGAVVGGLLAGGAAALAPSRIPRVGTARRPAELPATTPREVLINSADELTEEGEELTARHGFTPEEIKGAYKDAADPAPLSEGSLNRTADAANGETAAAPPLATARRASGDPAAPADAVADQPSAPTGTPAALDQSPDAGVTPSAPATQPSSRTAADRVAEAETLGIPLTRGQATQDFATQEAEQTLRAQATGEGEKARVFLTDQAEKIQTAVTSFREALGPSTVTKTERGQTVKDALRELRDAGKAGISALYREAEAMGGGALPLDTAGISDAAKRVLIEADVPDGVKNVVRQEMARYGLLGKGAVTAEDGLTTVKLSDGRKVQFYGEPQTLTVANAETFRQAISSQYLTDGPRKLSQSIKGALDDSVEATITAAASDSVGGPVGAKLREARQAVVEHKEKFAAKDVVQRLIDWRKGTKTDLVLPDHVMREVFAGDLTNLRKMKGLLLSRRTEKSKAAWSTIQADGIGRLFEQAYITNANMGGGSLGAISGAKLNTAINKFGIDKLKVLLDGPDFDRLMRLRRVIGEATIPIQNTTNPSGSGYVLMRFLAPLAVRFSGIPLAGPLLDLGSGLVEKAKATAEAQRTLAGMREFAKTEAARPAPSSTGPLSSTQADQAVDGFVQKLVEVSTTGRLVPAMLAAQTGTGAATPASAREP